MAYLRTPVTHSCPVCKGTQAELLHTITSDYAAQYYVLKESDLARHNAMKEEIERLWEGKSCRILRCKECGFCYADPFVPGDSRFYSLFYDDPKFPQWKWEYEETRTQMEQLIETKQLHDPRILEIGAGTGMFVQNIASSGLAKASNITTLEYSDAGREAIEKLGIRSLQEDVKTLGSEFEDAFDVVCMYQVLEHMDELDTVFSKLYKITGPQSYLFIAVPNSVMMTYYEENNAWLDNAPVHIGRWNRKSFEIIGARHNWHLDYHSVEPDSLMRRFLQFSLYKYVHHTKKSGSLLNWAESRKNRFVRYVFQIPLIGFFALFSLPHVFRLNATDIGSSQLVRFSKQP